jgi:hypothetical protein
VEIIDTIDTIDIDGDTPVAEASQHQRTGISALVATPYCNLMSCWIHYV